MSTKNEKRKESDERSGSEKREISGDTAKSRDCPQFIRVQMSENTRKLAGLTSPELLCIHQVRYLAGMTTDMSYIYDIVSRVLETTEDAVKLYVQRDGRSRPEESDGWMAVGKRDVIDGGTYLCVVREESLKLVSVDPVLIARGGGGTSQRSSEPSSPQASPPGSPSTPSIASSSVQGGPESTPPQNLLKLAVSQSLTDKSTDKEKVIQPFSSASFRKGVQSRDQKCVISGTEADLCEASHIIPHSLVRLKIFQNGVFNVGDATISDPDNPLLGILLEPGLNYHFNRHELSIYTGNVESLSKRSKFQDFSGDVHIFQTEIKDRVTSWTPSVRLYFGAKSSLKLRDYELRVAVMNHHYRHSLILAWGSDELKKRLTPSEFSSADDDELANLYCLELDVAPSGCFPTSPSSSATKPFF